MRGSVQITMTRTGMVEVEHYADRTHKCGANLADTHLRYKVEITGGPDALDNRGFIFDDDVLTNVLTHAVDPHAPFPSCERLAWQLCERLGGVAHKACRITVHLGTGTDQSAPLGMTAVWTRGDAGGASPWEVAR